MMTQWENECISLSVRSVARVQFPAVAEYFKGFSLADHFLPTHFEPAWLNLHSMAPNNLWTLRKKAEVQPSTDDG